MFAALTLSLLLPAATLAAGPGVVPAARSDDPPIKVWLSDDVFERGDRARVHVKAAEDGYLVVLRADADGRIRVLFPLDPADDNFVRGGKTYEIRGRGRSEAFAVDEREGTGTVVAARSATPFRFDEFVRRDHWDYRVLAGQRVGDDAEATLTDVVQRMAGDGHYDYDVVTYAVSPHTNYRSYAGWYDPFYSPCFGCGSAFYGPRFGFRVSIVFGRPYRHRLFYRPIFYDPFFYDPFFYDPFFYDPFFYDPFFDPFSYHPYCRGCFRGGFGFVTTYTYYRPVYRPVFGGGVPLRNVRRSPPFVLPRERAAVTTIGPRPRVPENVGLRRGDLVPVRQERPAARERAVRPLEQPLARQPMRPLERERLARPLIGDRWREMSGVGRRAPEARAPVSREHVETWSRPEVRGGGGRAPMIRGGDGGRRSAGVRGGGWFSPGARDGGARPFARGGVGGMAGRGRRH